MVHRLLLAALAAILPASLSAPTRAQSGGEIPRIAVSSNFSRTAVEIAERFEAETGSYVDLVFGSSGRHFAQIQNGAPFDALLSADELRPRLLETQGRAVPGTRFTYALGRLVLWSPRGGYVDSVGQVLHSGTFRHLAIANPRLAPYGRAAREVLDTLGVWTHLNARLVRGENVGQAYNFVRSGNAELGFVALSQVLNPDGSIDGSRWIVPASLYSPIQQQAVLLSKSEIARAFLLFVRSDEALSIIQSHGYDTP